MEELIKEIGKLEKEQAQLEVRVAQLEERREELAKKMAELGVSPKNLEMEISRLREKIRSALDAAGGGTEAAKKIVDEVESPDVDLTEILSE